MGAKFLQLDHDRVQLHATRPGRIPTLHNGQNSPDYPFPFILHENGLHLEPRMTAVSVPPKSFNLNPDDYAQVEVEGVVLLGIVLELADHHYDLSLRIDGVDQYAPFNCVSSYMPSCDGMGHIHWHMLDGERHHIQVRVSEQHNRMLPATGISPSHACLSGFLLSEEFYLPPPRHNRWMFTQDPLPADIRGRTGHLMDGCIPAQDYLYLMDLYGQGLLDQLAFRVDKPILIEILDGGARQAEHPQDFPAWIRRLDLSNTTSGAARTVFTVEPANDRGGFEVAMTHPAQFASRLIVRLANPFEQDARIEGLYMEGTLRCM
jgi:hypothetical protein